MSQEIDVLLVDDHAVVRTGYKAYLSLSDDIGEIYEAERGEVACQVYSQFQPHVVIMDLSMPGIGGLESIRRMLFRDPDCKILVFSIYNDTIFVIRALNAGAKGYITKNSKPDILIAAVRQVAAGNTFIDPTLTHELAAHLAINGKKDDGSLKLLSPREFDVFCLLARGMTSRDIAEKLCLSYKTVCNHTTSVKDKLNIKTLAELSLLAIREGIIETAQP